MTDDVEWLSAEQEGLWRQWLLVHARLAAALQRQLQDEGGLSPADHHVLVILGDSPDGRLRVTEVARLLLWERSRVSHHVTRMERRGLVDRQACGADGRGAFVGLTDAGRSALEVAAPGHVDAVRRLFLDPLGDQAGDLGALLDRLLAGHPAPAGDGDPDQVEPCC